MRSTERDHSDFTFSEGYLHLPAREAFVMQISDSIETLLHGPEFHQRHVLLVGLLQDVHPLH